MATAHKGAVTFYEELGVDSDVDQAGIERAYKKMALRLHPDKHPEDEKEAWTAKFQHLQEVFETLGNEQSRRVYDEKYLRKDRTGRVLVLMDMNGSLLFKLGKRECYGRPPAKPDWVDRDNFFFLRPGVRDFLQRILGRGSNIEFAIYTSRQAHNARPQVMELFRTAGCEGLSRQLFNIFAGDEFSVPDPDAGPHKSKRSLPRIWRDVRTCAARGVRFDECSTVNLDSDLRKLQDHPQNGIVVPNFGESTLGRSDDVLPRLADYLLRLAKECHGDVREFMRLFPFSLGGGMKPRALPPVSEFEPSEDGPSKGGPCDADVAGLAEQVADLTLGAAAGADPSA
mmetsp:Transcript_9327/g.27572  ORF Transcript_9327/g.27572 Transcript_9327/m.27572 type:complete len:341 (+) Transcript_9327:84-1106(+)